MAVKKRLPIKARKGTPKPEASAGGWQSTGLTRLRLGQYGAQPRDLRRDLSPFDRLSMVRKCRWAERNSGLFNQILNDLTLYTVGDGIKHQSHASTPEAREAYNDYFSEWAKKCDITGRFSFNQIQNILLRGMLRDGDSFAVKTRNGFDVPKLQIMESHRVGDPLSPDVCPPGMHDGVQFGPYGELAGFSIYRSDGSARYVISNAVMHVVDQEWASGARGVPILQSSVDLCQDSMDVRLLEILAMKDHGDVTRVLKKTGGFMPTDMGAELGQSTPLTQGQQYASMGGKILVLEPGEEMQLLASNRGSQAIAFLQDLERNIVRVLPYEFVSSPEKIGGASVRLVTAKAGRVFGKYQSVIITTLCQPTWGYVIGQAIANGELPDDESWTEVSWTTPKSVTVDGGRDSANDRDDLRIGLLSFSEIYNQRGMNFEEEAEIKAQNVRYLLDLSKTYGVPFETLSNLLINTAPGTVEQTSSTPQPDAETETSS
jgi:capsid protein